ncbi:MULTISPECIES: sporulation protein YunB [Mesobacillus]|uniref:Sporulation protein YunB n=1 Tax=Mesobacillus selenatarsenatis TaxID=388741 RepID=A0A846TKA5_9BACI|nr:MULTISPECIES: sporulation protein YunB [Mesobacillus]NKE07189.1 sporulation protein YunB [Mesobacillus selenatarsenatis]
MAKFGRRLPRKGPLPFRYVFLLTFVFFSFSTAAGLWIIDKGLEPTLMKYAESQTRKIATLVINKAINKKIASGMDIDKVIEFVPVDGGTTTVVKFNTEIINRVKAETTNIVQMNLKEAERGNLTSLEMLSDVELVTDEEDREAGIIYYVPLGQATNNALLGNMGPRVPVKFNAIGDVTADVVWETEEHGINNTLINVSVRVKVNVQIIIPFATEIATVQENIPIGSFYYPGKVPQFYNGGGDTSPAIQLPGE